MSGKAGLEALTMQAELIESGSTSAPSRIPNRSKNESAKHEGLQ
jgi:hypothetical protein